MAISNWSNKGRWESMLDLKGFFFKDRRSKAGKHLTLLWKRGEEKRIKVRTLKKSPLGLKEELRFCDVRVSREREE
jgi:hypothetical protein